MKRVWMLAIALVLCLSAFPLSAPELEAQAAGPITIDFNDLADEQFVGTHYPGLAFSPEWRAADHRTGKYCTEGFPPHSWPIQIWTGSEPPEPWSNTGRIDFDCAVSHFGGWFCASDGTVYLEAYDGAGVLLVSNSLGPNYGSSSYLSVSDSEGKIQYVIVHDSEGFWTVDDTEYIPAVGIKIIQPNGGESWAIGSTQSITWTSSDAIGNVHVSLSRDGGSTWQNIASDVANDGSSTWRVTGPTTNQALIKIASSSDPSTYDVSDTTFSITTLPNQPGPTIREFSPSSGYSGKIVSIVGTNFVKYGTTVLFGSIKVDPEDIDWSRSSSNRLAVGVPNAPHTAITGKITVRTSKGTAVSVDTFVAKAPDQPWGTQIGIHNGVPAYSNGAWWWWYKNDQGIPKTTKYGYAYQCVEYVNRYYVLALGHSNMIGSGHARTYYYNASSKGLERFANGGEHPPKVDDILVFYSSKNPYGHVAIVTNLVEDKNGNLAAIGIIQQNVVSPFQPNAKYRATATLSVQVKEKGGKTTYQVSNVGSGLNTPVVGWSRIPENP